MQGDRRYELTSNRKYLGELGVPSLPGSFLDVLSYFSRDDTSGTNTATGTSSGNGNGYGGDTIQMSDFVPQKSTLQGTTSSKPKSRSQPGTAAQAGGGASGSTSKSGSTAVPVTSVGTSNGNNKGKGKETPPVNPLNISGMSRM